MNTARTEPTRGRGRGRWLRGVGLWAVAVVAIAQPARPGAAEPERLEIVRLKAVRPTLLEIVAAIRNGDAAAARAASAHYDSLWNGIELYIGAHDDDVEEAVEHQQSKLKRDLGAPGGDGAMQLADAEALLAAYDRAIDLVVKSPPLDPRYDDVALLRMVRAHLREVVPALKAGDIDRARTSFAAFRGAWDSVAGLVRTHSAADEAAIGSDIVAIDQRLEQHDVEGTTTLVQDALTKYNATHAAVLKAARGR